jgi:hypothetical protein
MGKRFFANHKKSSALVISVAIHALFFLGAISFVAVTVIQKRAVDFEAREVKRPRMRLRRLEVPVNVKKPPQQPRLRKTIVTAPKNPSVDISLPEIVGVAGGLDGSAAGGFGGLGFGFELPDFFGSNRRGSGNEFIGRFYDLKQMNNGRLSEIGELAESRSRPDPEFEKAVLLYRKVLSDFVDGGWKDYGLKEYFIAPREKYATSFVIPSISAEDAPKAFGVEGQVNPRLWIAWYRGEIAAPESGRYRFVGFCDDYLFVRVKKNLVLDGSWHRITDCSSNDPDDRKYKTYSDQRLVVGDWFYAGKGKPLPVDILIGEEPGGNFFCQLYIQQEGVDYPTNTESYTDSETKETTSHDRPILPVFKTVEIPEQMLEKMKINPDWATAHGPVFGAQSNSG